MRTATKKERGCFCKKSNGVGTVIMSSSSEESVSSESEEETIDSEDKRKRGLPEGAPRIASGALIEGGDDEELRSVCVAGELHGALMQLFNLFLKRPLAL